MEKILGQVRPAADTDTTLYTVPAGNKAQGDIFVITTDGGGTVSIALVPSGELLSDKHWIAYSEPASELNGISRVCLGSGDSVVVHASTDTISVTLCGLEMS
ncbi:hypothetical protein [Limisalsivibrio acetivorans]|uniref:hypothetical protein n=1 Tax=Limisalsivibrio acetivorans TaxID=1304888 RepID=UPI0003B4EA65|nr:hypothetical protein [Limisalsivibrio acetivorans]